MSTLAAALERRLRGDDWSPDPKEPYAWASEAGYCARSIGYRMLAVPTAPPSLAQRLRWEQGKAQHRLLQAALADQYPGFKPEVKWRRYYVSGRADGTYHWHGEPVVVEIKTGMGAPVARPEPDRFHLAQAGVSAWVLGARWTHVVYMRADYGNRPLAEHRQILDPDAAGGEFARLDGVAQLVRAGRLPPRRPAFRDLDPRVTLDGCKSCPYLARCLRDGPDP